MKFVKYIIIVASEVTSAVGTKYLFDKWGITSDYGFANSWLRSYEGMRIRYKNILNEDLIDSCDPKSIEKFVADIISGVFTE